MAAHVSTYFRTPRPWCHQSPPTCIRVRVKKKQFLALDVHLQFNSNTCFFVIGFLPFCLIKKEKLWQDLPHFFQSISNCQKLQPNCGQTTDLFWMKSYVINSGGSFSHWLLGKAGKIQTQERAYLEINARCATIEFVSSPFVIELNK